MGYCGFTQYIGTCGHQWEVDATVLSYGTQAERKAVTKCPVPGCGCKAKVFADVDTTNGYGEEYGPDCVQVPMTKVGFTDEWRTDHYGNRYAVKHLTFKPRSKQWSPA